jgi:chromosome segregation ATPase
METSEKYQTVLDQIQRSKLSSQAMDTRLMLKNQEIQAYKDMIKSKLEMLSLQYHAINQMEKPLLVDQGIINHLSELKQLLAQKKSELSQQEAQMSDYIGKPFVKGAKLQNRWVQLSEEAYNGFKDFAEGPVQDLHLQLQLADLKIQELKTRVEESKEIYEGLEKEVQDQQNLVTDLQLKYKQSLDQLDLLTQENLRLKRITS